jgi:nicotinamide phosphoribosyltransferase
MGGGLLQQLDRDTLKFAMKCSSIGIRPKNDSVEFFGRKIGVNIEWRDVFKDPATDQGKSSKKGRVTLWESGGEYKTATAANELGWTDRGFFWKDALETYFEDGEVKFTQTFDQVRVNSCI